MTYIVLKAGVRTLSFKMLRCSCSSWGGGFPFSMTLTALPAQPLLAICRARTSTHALGNPLSMTDKFRISAAQQATISMHLFCRSSSKCPGCPRHLHGRCSVLDSLMPPRQGMKPGSAHVTLAIFLAAAQRPLYCLECVACGQRNAASCVLPDMCCREQLHPQQTQGLTSMAGRSRLGTNTGLLLSSKLPCEREWGGLPALCNAL